MDTLHKQEVRVRDLPTRSVTLFPTRAQVVRDIKDVALKPGSNEITVVGITPTADEQSIKVEGTGSAIITDITVELLPNRDIFQEIYPDSDDSESESDDDDDNEDETKDKKELDAVNNLLQTYRDKIYREEDIQASVQDRLKFLDAYGKSLDKKRGVEIDVGLAQYRDERAKLYQERAGSVVRVRELQKETSRLEREYLRLQKLQTKEKEKANKAKDKVQQRDRRRRDERRKEKARIRKERELFWPKLVYTVRITLEGSNFTPTSSRRSSIASAADVKVVSEKAPADNAAELTCDLSISYVTSSAFWSPSYDLALSTTTNTAMLCFDAQLTNMTSETWANSKVILSTSQANFLGLQDETPALAPWRLRLAGRNAAWNPDDGVVSREEHVQKQMWSASQSTTHQQKPRANLFGLDASAFHPETSNHSLQDYQMQLMLLEQQNKKRLMMARQEQAPPPFQLHQMQQMQQMQQQQPPPPGRGGPQISAPMPQIQALSVENSYGNTSAPAPNAVGGASSFAPNSFAKKSKAGASMPSSDKRRRSASPGGGGGNRFAFDDDGSSEEDDGQTMLEPIPEVSFQDSAFEETGLTATYDLPNLKTLKPSSTQSKQRVARISFQNVVFSRTVVAKYKPAAFLKGRLRNTSKLTLLKGPTGLTLDGTFMGRSTLPRCSAGDTFKMPLGVDPAIKVAYPKPDIKRSTTGVFTKGDNSVYTRTITLVNTRASQGQKPVEITVLDQVPVSEDEKLRIDVLYPRGMSVGGNGMLTGLAGGKEGPADQNWGRAVASLRKGGEVNWEVSLGAGKTVKLVLEYEMSLPTGERVIQC
ncbi:hypothetical protein QBC35DRAFT_476125 [Podospora australis]|uniref:Mucoidy inhibitor-like protein n=1 Tax=Podospora australis TaxID=1536484 RepID=A0AAN6WSW9_9PEZI|nr:hypothetical protein QBC35DRAFT_476125 [Podospora australis]